MLKYFDAHDHLQNYATADEAAAALAAAEKAGVERMLCCGTSPDDWAAVLELAGRYPAVTPAFGLHPWHSAEDGWLERLEEFLRRVPSCVGEIGLDGLNGRPGQEEDLKGQLQLARRMGRPAVLHCVKSWGRMQELLKGALPPRFMFHSYSGSAELVKVFAELGGYFSFGGEIMDPRRERLRAALAAAPRERLLFETESPEPDAPGWRAGPAGVAEVVAFAADLLGVPAAELAALSVANGREFLKGL